jgi:hypothetical protein
MSKVISGGTVTTVGGYTFHTFTSGGFFSTSESLIITILLIGGGGGGGGNVGGGGGGGGRVYNTSFTVAAGSNSVEVGSGGNGGVGVARGVNGSNSSFMSLTAYGGGGGGTSSWPYQPGFDGGCGGGAGGADYSYSMPGGYGTQGYSGGSTGAYTSGTSGSGGGGIGTVGAGSTIYVGGNGGTGAYYFTKYYSGGGGGAGSSTRGTGGSGGGGNGGNSSVSPFAGTANTGGGGGGGYGVDGAKGGSGIVIIRYETPLDATTVGEPQPETIDYGKITELSAKDGYVEFMGEITDQYINSLGYNERMADYKQPYIHDNYLSMMYVFDQELSLGRTIMAIVGSTPPNKFDSELTFSPQLASFDTNFNSYANYNYRIMGKVIPVGRTPTPPYIIPWDEYIIYEWLSYNTWTSGASQTLQVGNPHLPGSSYQWAFTGSHVGDISASSGLSITYTCYYRTSGYDTLTLKVGGVLRDQIVIHIWYPV